MNLQKDPRIVIPLIRPIALIISTSLAQNAHDLKPTHPQTTDNLNGEKISIDIYSFT